MTVISVRQSACQIHLMRTQPNLNLKLLPLPVEVWTSGEESGRSNLIVNPYNVHSAPLPLLIAVK